MPFPIVLALGFLAAEFPEAAISNGAVSMKVYLPDAARGYYRGTRFDWSGQIHSLRAQGHEYFGVWNPAPYNPKLHDAITGPVEEFRSGDVALGWNEAAPGGTFIRIGVGVLRKPPGEAKYENFRTYEIVDAGQWKTKRGRGWIAFTQTLNDGAGYAYRYTKTLRLVRDEAVLRIEHRLENTGRKAVATQQYNHNFFVMDGQPTGPASSVKFAFPLEATAPWRGGEWAEVRGSEIAYKRELPAGQSVFGNFAGGAPYEIEMANAKAGMAVRITGDRPIARIVYWSIRSTFCPEAYIDLNVPPGGKTDWAYTYEFKRRGAETARR
jgi:hypothetical protein